MVFFVCEGCNETLKKNKVDAHAARCRNCWAVSCVDCSVVFEGDDYAAHTSCMSEAQKYEGSLYREKKKPGAAKLSPQERWMAVVQDAKAPAGDSRLQGVLSRVAGYDNVPRKRAKFVNFMKNSVSNADPATVDRVWAIYEADFKTASEQQEADASNPAEDSSDSKKRSVDEAEGEKEEAPKSKKAKADKPIKWSKLIRKVLKAADRKQLEMSELQTRVLATVKDKQPSDKSDADLVSELETAIKAEADKFAVVKVVRLL